MKGMKKELFAILDKLFEKYPANVVFTDAYEDERIMRGMGMQWDMLFCSRRTSQQGYKLLTHCDAVHEIELIDNMIVFCELTNDNDVYSIYTKSISMSTFFGSGVDKKSCDAIFINIPYHTEEDFTLSILPKWIKEYIKQK